MYEIAIAEDTTVISGRAASSPYVPYIRRSPCGWVHRFEARTARSICVDGTDVYARRAASLPVLMPGSHRNVFLRLTARRTIGLREPGCGYAIRRGDRIFASSFRDHRRIPEHTP